MVLSGVYLADRTADAGAIVPYDDEQVFGESQSFVVAHDLDVREALAIRANLVLALDDEDAAFAQARGTPPDRRPDTGRGPLRDICSRSGCPIRCCGNAPRTAGGSSAPFPPASAWAGRGRRSRSPRPGRGGRGNRRLPADRWHEDRSLPARRYARTRPCRTSRRRRRCPASRTGPGYAGTRSRSRPGKRSAPDRSWRRHCAPRASRPGTAGA